MITENSLPYVYIVDDELSVRDSLSILLQSTGLKVKAFDSAETFLHQYDPEQPGCLILDVRMPVMNGHELQEQLSKSNYTLPIIFISGNAELSDSAKAFRAGAIDFIEKPINNTVLLERINEALQIDRDNRTARIQKQQLQERINRLTAREKDVLSLIIHNYSNKESAKLLNISNRTVEMHRAKIMTKMQADNIAELIMMVMQIGVANSTELSGF